MQSLHILFLSILLRFATARNIIAALGISVLLFGCTREEEIVIEPGYYLFENVNVLPMDRERIAENQRVVVRDGRIVSISASGGSIPEGAAVIDGAGHYLMPGLAEMHAHIPGSDDPEYAEDILFLFVSNGVTLVRGMAGDPYHLDLRMRVASGELLGPTIFAAGPWLGQHNAGSAEQTRETVRQHHAQGFDLLKVGSLSPMNYSHMAEEANRLGIPFAGHIPTGVPLARALEVGQASIDHLDRYVEFLAAENAELAGREGGFFGSGLIDLVDEARIPTAVELTREAGVWNVPTLSLVEHLASEQPPEEMIRWPEMRYLPDSVLAGWVTAKLRFQTREDFQPQAAQALVSLRRTLLKALHDGGAPIALGSDAPQFFNVPGFSIHREMAMMAEAGLSPYEVLVTGTRNPAQYFGMPERFGMVMAGLRADLILLKGNPFEDLARVQQPAGVMVRGRWLPEEEIQDRLNAMADRRASKRRMSD